jgi:hypothetical protein
MVAQGVESHTLRHHRAQVDDQLPHTHDKCGHQIATGNRRVLLWLHCAHGSAEEKEKTKQWRWQISDSHLVQLKKKDWPLGGGYGKKSNA